ncbi:T9SS type A sorting domain-containing protein [Hymenobacter tenuis]
MCYRYASVLVSLLLVGLVAPARSQQAISLSLADMPSVGDTLRLSQAGAATSVSLSQTGPNQTWDFSGLTPVSQRVGRIENVASTPGFLPVTFGPLSGVNRATQAVRQDLGPLAEAGLPVSEVYQFFNASAADYRQVGFGAVLQGTGLPATYQSQQLQDVVYRFPLTYGQKDSSNSDFTASVPTLAYLREKQKRVNHADGWGTLITPFGTFAALRVVSTLTAHDSLSVQSQPGTALDRVTREYKWLGLKQGLPLLQITTQVVAGRETVALLEYRDVYRRLSGPLANSTPLSESAVSVFPNPVRSGEPLRLTLPASAGLVTITATDVTGRLLFRQELTRPGRTLLLPSSAFGSFRGVVLLRVQTAAGVAVRRVVRE